jgi:hypothetical protein
MHRLFFSSLHVALRQREPAASCARQEDTTTSLILLGARIRRLTVPQCAPMIGRLIIMALSSQICKQGVVIRLDCTRCDLEMHRIYCTSTRIAGSVNRVKSVIEVIILRLLLAEDKRSPTLRSSRKYDSVLQRSRCHMPA